MTPSRARRYNGVVLPAPPGVECGGRPAPIARRRRAGAGAFVFTQKEAAALEGNGVGGGMNAEQILDLLPHRYPFLLVDRVLEYEPGRRAVGIKNVTINEPFFQGHYPGRPIMPGVLIVEAMAQLAGVAVLTWAERPAVPLIAGVDGVRFRRPVVPGDQLRLEAEVERLRGRVGKIRVKASVDGAVVAEGEIMFALASGSE